MPFPLLLEEWKLLSSLSTLAFVTADARIPDSLAFAFIDTGDRGCDGRDGRDVMTLSISGDDSFRFLGFPPSTGAIKGIISIQFAHDYFSIDDG